MLNPAVPSIISDTERKKTLSLTQKTGDLAFSETKLKKNAVDEQTQSMTNKLFDKGNKLWQKGKLDEAISTFQQVVFLPKIFPKTLHFLKHAL